MHTNAINSMFSEAGTAEKIKNNQVAVWCISPYFETMKNAAPIYHYRMFRPDVIFKRLFRVVSDVIL